MNGLCPPSVQGQGGIGEFCFLPVQRCNYYIITGLCTIYGGKELGRFTSFTRKEVYYHSRHVSEESICLLPSARQQRQLQRPAATPSPQGQARRSASLLGVCFAPVRRVFWAACSLQTPSSVAPLEELSRTGNVV